MKLLPISALAIVVLSAQAQTQSSKRSTPIYPLPPGATAHTTPSGATPSRPRSVSIDFVVPHANTKTSRAAYPVPPQYKPNPQAGFYSPEYARSENRQHTGVDIPAPAGTSVYSTSDGRVIANNSNRSSAADSYILVQDQVGNSQRIYGHITSTTTVGQAVKAGETIGRVRDYGPPGPAKDHLHFGKTDGPIQIGDGWGWGRSPATSTPQEAYKRNWRQPFDPQQP